MKRFINIVFLSIAMTFVMAMLFSCENDMKTIQRLSISDTMPDEIIYDVEMAYSDSGNMRVILRSPVMYTFSTQEGKTIFPEGFIVSFYGADKSLRSYIKAKYGIQYFKERKVEAKNNVVVENIARGEKLETEHLIWDQKRQKIHTEAFVKIITPDKILFGKGLEADESFKKRIIKKISGEFLIEPDE
ncbi:MAG: LPS export ABC transporter periplasmic protein LptC [Bacteroidales bacterium]|nr:LPS export ABC transporter periplasmic protein LptC [Bacteroidales bacterium]